MDSPLLWNAMHWAWIAFLIGLSLYGYWQLRIRENLRVYTSKEVGRLAEEKDITTNNDGRLRAVSRPLIRLEQEEDENQNGSNDNSVILGYVDKLDDRLGLIRSFNRELDKRLMCGWLSFAILTVGTAYLLLTSTEYIFSANPSLLRAFSTANAVFWAYANEPFAVFYGQPPVKEAIFEGGRASVWVQRYVSFVIPSQLSLGWFGLNFFIKPRAFEENIAVLKRNIKLGRKDPAAFRKKILGGSFGDRASAAIAFLVEKLFGPKDRRSNPENQSGLIRLESTSS